MATKAIPAIIAGLINGIKRLKKVEIEFLPNNFEASINDGEMFMKATLATI